MLDRLILNLAGVATTTLFVAKLGWDVPIPWRLVLSPAWGAAALFTALWFLSNAIKSFLPSPPPQRTMTPMPTLEPTTDPTN